MRAVGCSIFLVLLVVGGLFLVRSGLLRGPGVASTGTVSPDAAAEAEAKLNRLQGAGEEIRLSDGEITSLLRYRPEVWSLGAVSSPVIAITGDTIRLSGTVDPAVLPERPETEALRLLLPDTTRIDVAGTLGPLEEGTAVVRIASVEVLGLPFPSRYFPVIVDRLGLERRPDIPDSAFALPLPPGIRSARVADGALVLTP